MESVKKFLVHPKGLVGTGEGSEEEEGHPISVSPISLQVGSLTTTLPPHTAIG